MCVKITVHTWQVQAILHDLTQLQPSHPFYSSTCFSQRLQWRIGGFCSGKFYCPRALADGNQCIRIREKTLEFSSTVLSTLSPYLILHDLNKVCVRWCLYQKGKTNLDFTEHPPPWPASRHSIWSDMTSVDTIMQWTEELRGLVVSLCGQTHYCYRPHYPIARFQSLSSYMVSDKPFQDRSRPMSC